MSSSQLAPELLNSILTQLVTSETSAGLDFCNFSRCSRLFNSVSSDDALWRFLYLRRWRRHKSRAAHVELLLNDTASNSKSASLTCWKQRYGKRHLADRGALDNIRLMVNEPVGRYAEARNILQEAEMDVFDALLKYQDHLLGSIPLHEALSEKLWVKDVLDSLRRSEALQIWLQMIVTGGEVCSLGAISAFSGFRGCDRVELEDKLDLLAKDARKRLGEDYLATRPDQILVARKICEAMGSNGIVPSDTQDFHKLRNHFLNLVIDQAASTLPMTLVCIFCGIAERLGLRASLVGFPQRILCRLSGWTILSSSSQAEEPSVSCIIDIFDGGRVLSPEEINRRLQIVGIPASHAENFLHAARPTELVARVGRNIITSLQQEDGGATSHMDTSRSAHAAVAALLFLQPNNLVDALPNILHQFPMDVYSIEKDYIPVVLREGVEGLLMSDRLRRIQKSILEKDATEIQPRFREQERNAELGDHKDIMYKIGTIFRHRRWGYTGVIRRWDPRCCADNGWMQQNNIDALDNGGRSQPFYSISADDGSDRYIAQVNIIPMQSVAMNTLNRIIRGHEDLGAVFARADPDRALFVLEAGARRVYPEDAKWQEEILSRPPSL